MKQCKVLVRLELNKHRNVILERFWLCQFSAYKYHVPGGYSSLLGIIFLIANPNLTLRGGASKTLRQNAFFVDHVGAILQSSSLENPPLPSQRPLLQSFWRNRQFVELTRWQIWWKTREEFSAQVVDFRLLDQWFLTFFTYLNLLSNKITRFSPSTLSGVHLLKIRN